MLRFGIPSAVTSNFSLIGVEFNIINVFNFNFIICRNTGIVGGRILARRKPYKNNTKNQSNKAASRTHM
jgi:hypothetical protein